VLEAVDLRATRAELGVLERCVYLNTGTFGPIPGRALEAMGRGTRQAVPAEAER